MIAVPIAAGVAVAVGTRDSSSSVRRNVSLGSMATMGFGALGAQALLGRSSSAAHAAGIGVLALGVAGGITFLGMNFFGD